MWALGFLKPRPTCMVATSPRKATASQPTSMPQDYSRTTTIPTSLPVAIREKPRERCTTTTTVRTLRRKTFTRASTASTSSSTRWTRGTKTTRSEEHTSELQSLAYLVCRLLLEKKKKILYMIIG